MTTANVRELTGELTAAMAMKILPVVKRVEIKCKGSNGHWVSFKYAKKEAYEFLGENPDIHTEVQGDVLYISV